MTIVRGEEELGEQRVCKGCGEPWPLDEEFYRPTGKAWWQQRCRACLAEFYAASARRSKQRRKVTA